MIFYLLLYVVVLPLLAVGGIVYAIKVREAIRHAQTHAHPDHRPTTWQIMVSVFFDLLWGTLARAMTFPALAASWLGEQWRRLRSQFSEPAAPAPAATAPNRPAAQPRIASGAVPVALVPDLPDDVIDPGEAAAIQGSVVPADWAAVIARIATFEPEDDAALVAFIRSEAAVYGPMADAWRSLADTLINVIGVDPAAAHGVLELADTLSETAHAVALAQRRFVAVYAQVLEAVSGGLQLPHSGRWLTGGAA